MIKPTKVNLRDYLVFLITDRKFWREYGFTDRWIITARKSDYFLTMDINFN